MSGRHKALFLDRDGVLDELVYYDDSRAYEAPRRVADLKLVPGVVEALRRAREHGWRLFIVTNQPDYAKGKTTKEDLDAVHKALLERIGVAFDAAYRCLHHPEATVEDLRVACECRKPGAQFLREAARDHQIDLSQSWMIGDQATDAACGRAAGCRVALVDNPATAPKRAGADADVIGRDLTECIDRIIAVESA